MDDVQAGAVAVIFVGRRTAADPGGYAKAAAAMDAAAAAVPGYPGVHAVRDADGHGITVSYRRDAAAARAWHDDASHAAIHAKGRAAWYDDYEVVVATVDRARGWRRDRVGTGDGGGRDPSG